MKREISVSAGTQVNVLTEMDELIKTKDECILNLANAKKAIKDLKDKYQCEINKAEWQKR